MCFYFTPEMQVYKMIASIKHKIAVCFFSKLFYPKPSVDDSLRRQNFTRSNQIKQYQRIRFV